MIRIGGTNYYINVAELESGPKYQIALMLYECSLCVETAGAQSFARIVQLILE